MKKTKKALLGVASALALSVVLAVPAFAWTSSNLAFGNPSTYSPNIDESFIYNGTIGSGLAQSNYYHRYSSHYSYLVRVSDGLSKNSGVYGAGSWSYASMPASAGQVHRYTCAV